MSETAERICFLAPYAYSFFFPAVGHTLGGAERQQVRLARALVRDGWRVSFIVADFGQPVCVNQDGIELVASFPVASRLPGLVRLPWKYLRLLLALRRKRGSLIFLRSNLALAVLLWLAKALFGVRYVYNFANDSDLVRTALDSRLLFAAFCRAVRAADGLVAQTVRQQELARRRLGRRAVLVRSLPPEPLDPDAVLPLAERRFVLWVGRLEPIQKQPLMFVELARRMPDQQFLMIGQPMGDEKLTAAVQAAARELPNLAYRERVAPGEIELCYRQALALVCTSIFEGFPNTFLEAWSGGTPVVSTLDPDSLVHCYGVGRVFDSVEAAARQIHELRQDPVRYAATSASCLALVREQFAAAESLRSLKRVLRRSSTLPGAAQ